MEGARLFESPVPIGPGAAAGEPLAWTRVGNDGIVQVHDGSRAVRCWHNAYCQQRIRVRKEVPVTVRARAWSEVEADAAGSATDPPG